MAYYHSRYGKVSKKRKKGWHRFILVTLTMLIIIAGILAFTGYKMLFTNNVWLNNKKAVSIYIPTGSDYEDVKTILYSKGIILHRNSFEWVAKKKKYPAMVKPGHYVIKEGMSNDELINLLRTGKQTPVNVIFNNIRNKEQLAKRISTQIEADSTDLISLLTDTVYIARLGFSEHTVLSLFVPNTYELYWNTNSEQFIERMYSEYKRFWNNEREEKAKEIGLTIPEVVTLASIVEKETAKNEEKDDIAGVYMNRLEKGWRLQADPTLIYAHDDYSIKRVLNRHKTVDSPYNTYKYRGLPPGPICIPSIASINAVLNYTKHDYMYFCAKDDMIGYHVFAKTSAEHGINARKYQKALDEMKIKK